MSNSAAEKPIEQFCLACEQHFFTTPKDFRGHGHTDDAARAKQMYGMTDGQIRRVRHKLSSGAYIKVV